ncbi:MAG: hypothetical protein ACRDK9_13760 [Solirubrobacterales bacterium]
MSNTATYRSGAESAGGSVGVLTGLGVLTMALFPLSIPIVLLTAVSLVPLLPVVILGVVVVGAALALRGLTSLFSRRGR